MREVVATPRFTCPVVHAVQFSTSASSHRSTTSEAAVQVLNVEQAAVLLIISHPYHPDCLAIANLMAQNQRNVTSGTDVRQ